MARSNPKPDLKSIGYEGLLEDLFGLNILGVKSLWATFTRPADYYEASEHLNWRNAFTPSFRLWFALIAISFFFQFFWAGTNSATIQTLTDQLEQAPINLPDGVSAKMAAIEFTRWNFGFLPFTYILSFFMLAAAYHAWGEKLNFVMRQRKVFLTIIPSTLLTLPLTLSLGFIGSRYYWIVMAAIFGMIFIVSAVTAYRGAFPAKPRAGRLTRATGLGLAITFAHIFGAALSNIAANAAIMIKYVN